MKAEISFSHHCSGIVFFVCASMGFQNMHSDTKLTVKDAAGADTPSNLLSPQPEGNGRHPGQGFGQQI